MSKSVSHKLLQVYRRYLGQIAHLVALAPPAQLGARLSEDSFTGLQHFSIAQGYVLRAVYPALGREVPELPECHDVASLLARGAEVERHLEVLEPDDFDQSRDVEVTHIAGEAQVTQSACDFIDLYALPNFFFHLSMGYAILRTNGVSIGKGDFDGFHSYPNGFSFVTNAAETV